MYWEQQPDVRNEAVSAAMPRKKFEDLLRYFHVSDNSCLQKDDRFAKVRPLLASLNERWLLFKPPRCHVSYSMWCVCLSTSCLQQQSEA